MHIILGKKDSRENYVVRNTVRLLISCSRRGQVARVSLFLGYICTFVITARLYRDKDHSCGVCKIRWYRWSRLFLKNLLVLLIGKSSIPLSLLEKFAAIHSCLYQPDQNSSHQQKDMDFKLICFHFLFHVDRLIITAVTTYSWCLTF